MNSTSTGKEIERKQRFLLLVEYYVCHTLHIFVRVAPTISIFLSVEFMFTDIPRQICRRCLYVKLCKNVWNVCD